MSASLFGSATPTQNPFATASSRADTQLNSFNFIQAPSAFGAPSCPNSNVFGSKITSLGSTACQKIAKSNLKDDQLSFFNNSARASNKTGSAPTGSSTSTKPLCQPFSGLARASEINPATTSNVSGLFGSSISAISNQNPTVPFTNSLSKPNPDPFHAFVSRTNPSNTSENVPTTFAEKIQAQLDRDGIIPPSLATLEYDKDPTEFIKSATELRMEFLKYRERVRVSLIKANLLDDPNVPKKLEDAIDFKGTCDKMCPDYECLTRMVDRRYDKTERDIKSDGSLSAQPNPMKMVKALARSAAGQDAPLPGDIRTAAALRKTIDFLFNRVLAERELEVVHGFLWDRTRAVRRDFVFHSSMTPAELVDQVYCLERIIRFHVISLHYMSKDGITTDGFSDQQEREQLSKSLLSLIHAYEDCKLQGVYCENEVEFKAYYILFNGEIPGIMETVQNWGWEVWENSEIIRIAVSLSESLQNTWDFHGPLNPISTMEISQNAYSRFFCIVEDPGVSYTMACFAEIYFNKIRKAILRTILHSYRKQRGKTKDWTLEKLNTYLRFDNENEVEPFVELYGLQFSEIENEWCLSFDSVHSIQDPHPLPKQPHSYHLVEKKRGKHTLSEAINHSVYESMLSSASMPTESHELLSLNQPSSIQPISKSYAGLGADSQDYLQIKNPPSSHQFRVCGLKQNTSGKQNSIFNSVSPPDNVSTPLFTGFGVDSSKISNFSAISSNYPSKESSDRSILFPPSTIPFTQAPALNNCQNLDLLARDSSESRNPGQALSQHEKKVDSQIANSTLFISEDEKIIGSQSTTPKSNPSKPLNVGLYGLQAEISTLKEKHLSQAPETLLVQSSNSATSQLSFPSNPPVSMTNCSTLPTRTFLDVTVDTPSVINSAPTELVSKALNKKKNSRLDHLTEWIVMGDEGLLEQFAEIQASKLVYEVFTSFKMIQIKNAQEEADRVDRDKADHFRRYNLSVKYGYLWREQARRLRIKRKGREARQARRQMAQNIKMEKEALSSNLVEDFRASTSMRRRQRESQGSLENSPEDLAEELCHRIGTSAYINADQSAHKRRRSEKSVTSEISSISSHQPVASISPKNRHLLSDPSFLSGESRIHLLSNHLKKDEKQKHLNGVQTDYFRLKARGITPLTDGTFFPHTSKKHSLTPDQERPIKSLGCISKSNEDVKSVSSISNTRQRIEACFLGEESDNEHISVKQGLIFPYEIQMHKRQWTDDDMSLFDRAKKIRDQMDEGADWFRKEIVKGTSEYNTEA